MIFNINTHLLYHTSGTKFWRITRIEIESSGGDKSYILIRDYGSRVNNRADFKSAFSDLDNFRKYEEFINQKIKRGYVVESGVSEECFNLKDFFYLLENDSFLSHFTIYPEVEKLMQNLLRDWISNVTGDATVEFDPERIKLMVTPPTEQEKIVATYGDNPLTGQFA